jgi:hypothetical protein
MARAIRGGSSLCALHKEEAQAMPGSKREKLANACVCWLGAAPFPLTWNAASAAPFSTE